MKHTRYLAITDVVCGFVTFLLQIVILSLLDAGHEILYLNLVGLITGPLLIVTGVTILKHRTLDARRFSVVMKLVVLALAATFCLMGISIGTTIVCMVLTKCIRHDFTVATFLHPIIHVTGFVAVVANSLLARRLHPAQPNITA